MRAKTRDLSWLRVLWGLGLAAFLLLGLGLIVTQHLGRVDGRWVAWLEDDAMVSMQVARQFLGGHGLVWTLGERVEAYSDPLWVLVLALCQWLIPGRDLASLGPLLLDLALGVWLIVATRRLARALGATEALAVIAALGLGLSEEVLWAAGSGLETVAMAAVMAEAWASLAEMQSGKRPWGFRPFGMAALAGLLRFDGLLFTVLLLGLAWTRVPKALKPKAVAVALVPVAAAWCFRLAYYGAWVPNTVTLKAGAWDGRWTAGFFYVWRWTWDWALAGLAALSALHWRRFWPWWGVLLAISAYGLTTGGDFFPGTRYLAPAWPLIWALAAAALAAGSPRWSVPLLLICALFSYNAVVAWPGLMQDGRAAHLQRIQAADDLQARLQPGQSLAAAWAGALYYFSDARGIDLLGKADPVIAHLPGDPALGITAHNKMDLGYSLGVRHPDWVLLLPPGAPHSAPYDRVVYEDALFKRHCTPQALPAGRVWMLCRCRW